jgi:hypothetical protein
MRELKSYTENAKECYNSAKSSFDDASGAFADVSGDWDGYYPDRLNDRDWYYDRWNDISGYADSVAYSRDDAE